MTSNMMRRLIQANGHLKLVGDETRQEMQEALLNLYWHQEQFCRKPELGTPVVALVPEIALIQANPGRKRKVETTPGV